MKYRVTHKTEYYYDEPVPLCHNVVRLRPRETARQTCLRCALTISPVPAARRDRVDFFGNHATWVSLQEPHEVLKVEAVSEVEVRPAAPNSPAHSGAAGPSWEQVRDALAECREPELYAVKEFTFDSPHVRADPQLAHYAGPSFAPGRPLLECVTDLTRRIHREFTFDPRSTTIGTPVLEVLRNRRGVCQDFAHLQVGCLRSLGLAGRYVSGYILTHPPPGQKRLVGCDASHAWVSAYVPGPGWVDFDPTNGLLPDLEHITVGWARDYDDVSPIRGVLVGGHRHSMYFGVGVEPLDPPPAAGGANGKEGPKEATEAKGGRGGNDGNDGNDGNGTNGTNGTNGENDRTKGTDNQPGRDGKDGKAGPGPQSPEGSARARPG